MRIAAAALFTTAAVLTAAPASAQTYAGNYPICLQYYRWGGSDIQCAYTSLAQCAASGSGLGATCIQNPYFARAQMPIGPAPRMYR
jgi:hypothetical protein